MNILGSSCQFVESMFKDVHSYSVHSYSVPPEGYMIQTFNWNTCSDVMLLTVQICTPNKMSAIATQGFTKQKA